MNLSSSRAGALKFFLWVSVSAWGVALGGKLFNLLVIISAWAANPPTSLSLLPYGPRYPIDPGDFFQPLMLLIIVGLVGALISGWQTPRTYKLWLWVPLIAFLIIAFTAPTIFWPMIRDLNLASTGSRPLTETVAQSLANRFVVYDWGRTALVAVGFFSAVRSISKAASLTGT